MQDIREFVRENIAGIRDYARELKEDSAAVLRNIRFIDKPGAAVKKEEETLRDFLPYRSFDPKHGLFINKQSIGFVLRVSHFNGISHQVKQALQNLIRNDIPSGCHLQVINYASPKIGDILQKWQEGGAKADILEQLARYRTEFLVKGSWSNILGSKGSFVFRDFELYLCASLAGTDVEARYTLEAFRHKLTAMLKNMGCYANALNDRDIGVLLKEIFNPSSDLHRSYPVYRHEDIRDYLSGNYKVKMHRDGVVISQDGQPEKFKYLLFEVVRYPDTWRLEESLDLVGQFENGLVIPCPFMLVHGFKLESSEKSKRLAESNRMLKIKQTDSKLPAFFPKMLEEREEWGYVSENLDKGDRLGKQVMYVMAIINNENNEQKTIQIIKDHFARLNFGIEQIKYDTLNNLISIMPMGLGEYWPQLEQLKIPHKTISTACMNIMPVFADTANYSSPFMLFSGRRGQLYYFDNFQTADDQNGNYNMVVVGKPGSGKSVFLQEYTTSILRFGGQVVVLDDGRSSQNSCGILEGDFVDFANGNFCINPFSLYGVYAKQASSSEYEQDFEEPFIDLVVSILCIIANVDKNNSKDPEVGLYKTVMTNVVSEVMSKYGGQGGFKEIWQELKDNPKFHGNEIKAIVERLVYILEGYAIGRYASFYNGEATLNVENSLTVFEFSDLEYSEILQNSVLMTVIFLVYSKMQARVRRTSLIIDEAWRLLGHPNIKGFIQAIARRARKYNGSLVVATQSISDFSAERSEAGAAVLKQSEWRVLLNVSGDDEPMLKGALNMSDAEISVAQNMSGLKGSYSEFMIRNDKGNWQIGRLFFD
jgi:conjugal transfer ATP-binding protein TraC